MNHANEEESSSFIGNESQWTVKIKRQKDLINDGEKWKLNPCAQDSSNRKIRVDFMSI